MTWKIDKCFMTGCDEKTEWSLEWFIDNYRAHNDIPMIFANFGVSESMLRFVKESGKFQGIMDVSHKEEKGWFLKPYSMLNTPAKMTYWIDTDCEDLDDISPLFDMLELEKLSMAVDKPWTKRREELWFNSGVVGFKFKPTVLYNWVKAVRENPTVGDQETLHLMLGDDLGRTIYMREIPNEYNWLRVQLVNDNQDSVKKKIMHWTGPKGNMIIKEKIKNGVFSTQFTAY